MADDSEQEKTEDPTFRRLQEAADEGRVARSQELMTAALMLGSVLTLRMVAPGAGEQLMRFFGESLEGIGSAGDSTANIGTLTRTGWTALGIVGLLCSGIAAVALVAGAAQARGTWTLEPLVPKWNRINPLTNAKQLLSSRAIAELLKACIKIVLVGVVAYVVMRDAWPDLVDLGTRDATSLVDALGQHGGRLFLIAGIAYLALAAADYGWQLWQHLQQLRMSKDEVKRESKQQDGDPMVKARMRSIGRARLRRQMLRDVAKADVVIVNPTHRAIALRYDPLAAPAPIVLAMGERKVAERIREIAKEAGVPIIENRPLAIALIASARVGMMIPAELYAAVAEVLAFVFRQKARSLM
jgi:flagellar biosynthetic protein FlhB